MVDCLMINFAYGTRRLSVSRIKYADEFLSKSYISQFSHPRGIGLNEYFVNMVSKFNQNLVWVIGFTKSKLYIWGKGCTKPSLCDTILSLIHTRACRW